MALAKNASDWIFSLRAKKSERPVRAIKPTRRAGVIARVSVPFLILLKMENSLSNKNTVFRPTASESKADNVTRIVKEMTEADTSARQAKTEKLRASRIERDISEKSRMEEAPKNKVRKTSKKPKPTT